MNWEDTKTALPEITDNLTNLSLTSKPPYTKLEGNQVNENKIRTLDWLWTQILVERRDFSPFGKHREILTDNY